MKINDLSIKELTEVAKAMSEGDFYKEFNGKIEGELGRLAKYLNETRKKLQFIDTPIKGEKDKFPEASSQLIDVTRATEEAAHKIMTLTEKILDDQDIIYENLVRVQGTLKEKINDEEVFSSIDKVLTINQENKNDLVDLMTSLSFQDLTGQKIKKIVQLVQDIEKKITELLQTFNLERKEKKKEIINEIKETSKSSDLKQDLVVEILEKFL